MNLSDVHRGIKKHKKRRRIGRGPGSGHGKTSGRGHKGAGSRSGNSRRPYFEGGQMSFVRRIPKRGFSNADFRNLHHVVNVKTLEERFGPGAEIDAQILVEAGVIRDADLPLKILGEGELTKKLTVTAARFSASARSKIEAAGGTVNEVAKVKWTRASAGPSARRLLKKKGPRRKGAGQKGAKA